MSESTLKTISVSAPIQSASAQVTSLLLLVQCENPTASPVRYSLSDIDVVVIGRGNSCSTERTAIEGKRQLQIRIPDLRMSSSHARLTRTKDGWEVEDLDSKNGTVRNGIAEQHGILRDGDLVECGYTFFRFREGTARRKELNNASFESAPLGMATLNSDLNAQFMALGDIAASTIPVLITGESGTGKELIARAVHSLSGRAGQFVAVNCGALPRSLVEAELFGYRKGAFSGAAEDRLGLVRAADHGTLFLDEIGDLPLVSQAALLRVLQEREVLPIGATKPIPVELRVVAATHRNLDELIAKGLFRPDLLARLTGFNIGLPPLRDRIDDFAILLKAILERGPQPIKGPRFSCEAIRMLLRYRWPLNIRELEKSIGTAIVLSGGDVDVEHLPAEIRSARPELVGAPAKRGRRELTEVEQRRRDELIALFERYRGNISAVARETGKARFQIRRWIELYQIDLDPFR